jgi:hypothetical protein
MANNSQLQSPGLRGSTGFQLSGIELQNGSPMSRSNYNFGQSRAAMSNTLNSPTYTLSND